VLALQGGLAGFGGSSKVLVIAKESKHKQLQINEFPCTGRISFFGERCQRQPSSKRMATTIGDFYQYTFGFCHSQTEFLWRGEFLEREFLIVLLAFLCYSRQT
jgi:hypothetical protein